MGAGGVQLEKRRLREDLFTPTILDRRLELAQEEIG